MGRQPKDSKEHYSESSRAVNSAALLWGVGQELKLRVGVQRVFKMLLNASSKALHCIQGCLVVCS